MAGGVSTSQGTVSNNMIYINNTASATVYGIYDYYGNNMNYYSNSINCASPVAASCCFYNSWCCTAPNSNLINNIFANTGGGYCILVLNLAWLLM